MKTQPSLTVRLKSLGFTPGNKMRLYGEKFEIAGEPIVVNDNEVLVDAIEVKSVKMAHERAA